MRQKPRNKLARHIRKSMNCGQSIAEPRMNTTSRIRRIGKEVSQPSWRALDPIPTESMSDERCVAHLLQKDLPRLLQRVVDSSSPGRHATAKRMDGQLLLRFMIKGVHGSAEPLEPTAGAFYADGLDNWRA
mmetsp:Transcript_54660/g.98165  ORF Transcript_54660/g.98165 Transcript_54660/m.98165 type:complete len:131 (+) Transcript_54660:460-852(+)